MGEQGLGNGLTRSAVNIKVRDHLRRVGTGPNHPNGNTRGHFGDRNIMDDEESPLLGLRHGVSHASLHPNTGFWRHLLLNPHSSPGTDSPNPFIRWPAHAWNVTKVTLFSCMFPIAIMIVPPIPPS